MGWILYPLSRLEMFNIYANKIFKMSNPTLVVESMSIHIHDINNLQSIEYQFVVNDRASWLVPNRKVEPQCCITYFGADGQHRSSLFSLITSVNNVTMLLAWTLSLTAVVTSPQQQDVPIGKCVRISMVTLIDKRMALKMGQFSGFLPFTNSKPYPLEGD